MCGRILKLSVLVLLFFFSRLSGLYSEVVLTDEEYSLVMTALETSDKELTEAKKEIEKLEMSLMRLDKLLAEQVTELATLKINYELQSKSYELLKKRVDLIWLDRAGFGLIGGLAGFGVNEILNRLE